MRITNNILSHNLLTNLEAAQGRMDDLQNQLSSGYRITKPSDDPVGIQNALRMKSSISVVEQWKSNASEGLAYMNTADSTLGDITSMLQKIRELTVQAANGTNTVGDQTQIKQEVDQLTDQIRTLANTKVSNKYIFAGTATDQEPLPTPTSTWQGNAGELMFFVGNNLNLPVSVNGRKLFEVDAAGNSSLFDDLKTLSTALSTPQPDASGNNEIENSLARIDRHIDNVLALRADLGARMNRITAISDQLGATSLNLQQNLSDIQDADMAKTITDFTGQQNVYKAALAVGAQIIQPSLVDFMK